MKKLFCFLIFISSVHISHLFGVIVEAEHFSEIKKYVKSHTLVILDIDDTLLIPKQMLGTDVWFRHRINEYQRSGISADNALQKTLLEWEAIRFLTDIEIVEEGTETVVKEMQENKITIMGLTTQGLTLANCTIHQLESLNIDLTATPPSSSDHYFMNGVGVLYRDGILFTSGSHKGKALIKLLDAIGYTPEHVLFINDKKTHISEVEESVVSRGINFIGLRYSYSDKRVSEFDPQIAEIQWRYSSFEHLLTDEEARIILEFK